MPIFPGPARLFVSVATVFVLSACAQMDMHRGGHEPATHAGHAGHGVNMGAPAAAPVALDARTVVDVTPQESAHVLGDMQNLLRSVGEINGALAAVPHIGYPDGRTAAQYALLFCPARPAAGAPFGA